MALWSGYSCRHHLSLGLRFLIMIMKMVVMIMKIMITIEAMMTKTIKTKIILIMRKMMQAS